MNPERTVTEWLRAEAASRAPDQLLARTLETVAVVPQERVLWRRGPLASRRGRSSRTVLALASTLVALGLLGGSLALLGARMDPPPTPTLAVGLAYAYGIDGDIFLAEVDGTNPVRIADPDPNDTCGQFGDNRGIVSPDGRYVAYRSSWDDDCPGIVYLADAAGNPVASFPGVGWNIAWSPDSTRLATWLDLFETVAVYGIDGTRQAVVDGSLMCCGDHDPVWSPDGAASILVKTSGPESTVYELPVEGGTPRAIPADDPRSYLGQSWDQGKVAYSPDGTRAAVVAFDSLITVAVDGTERHVLIDARPDVHLSHVLWSPTGDRIAYLALEEKLAVGSALQLVDPSTGTVTTLAAAQEGSEIVSVIGFSPDGDRILYGQLDDEDASLWVASADGSGARMLVGGTLYGGWLQLPAGTDRPATPATPSAAPDAGLLSAGAYVFTNPHGADEGGRCPNGCSDYRSVTFTLPDGWATTGALFYKDVDRQGRVAFSFWTIDSTYDDSCQWQTSPMTAFALDHSHSEDGSIVLEGGRPPFDGQDRDASRPVEVSIGSEAALRMELHIPRQLDLSACDLGEYRSWIDVGGQSHSDHAAGQTDVIYLVDVDRSPLVIDASYMPDTTPADRAELEGILASMQITR